MTGKSILLITSWYNRSENNPNLINDLSAQLSRDGHKMVVIAADWDGQVEDVDHYVESNGAEVVFIAPPRVARRTLLRRALRFLTASFTIVRKARKHLGNRHFDLVLVVAPISNQLATVDWALRRFRARSYLYITDFFPHHHRQIGVMPGGAVFRAALAIETAMMRRFDVIGCLSPANLAYLRGHYDLRGKPRTEILGLWGPTDRPAPADKHVVRNAHGLPCDRAIVVYGGQLSAGRGFDEVLEAARLAADRRPDLFFLIIGQGPLEKELGQAAADSGNIAVKPRIPREDYLTLLAACDVGIVCTVPNVDIPTFPSKTIDLLRAGVPIAASVERTTDYADFVRDNGVGIAVEAGSADRLLHAIASLVDQPDRRAPMIEAARETLDRIFDVGKVSRRLIEQSFPEEIA